MTFQNKVRIRELNDAFCRREGVREQDGQQSLGFQARPGTRRTAQGTFDYPPATAGSAQLIHTRFRSSVEQRAFFAFIEVNEPEGSPVSDRNRDSEDIGRAINIIIQAMGRTPYSNPREASAKFATDDLTQFRSELPIEDQSVALPGAPRFTFQSSGQIICGGSGVVFQVRDPDADRHYALKFVRPSLLDKKAEQDSVFTESKKEFLNHAPLSHNNIARIFGAMHVEESRSRGHPTRFEPILMEWIENATPLSLYIYRLCSGHRPNVFCDIISLLVQSLTAISYIHRRDILHWDVKSANLLVESGGTVKLSDFGNARILSDSARGKYAFSTKGNLPPGLDKSVRVRSSVTTTC